MRESLTQLLHSCILCHKESPREQNPTLNDKLNVHQICITSTLLYCSETWTRKARQGTQFNACYTRCLRKIMSTICEDKVTDSEVDTRTTFKTLSACSVSVACEGLVMRTEWVKSRIPKDI